MFCYISVVENEAHVQHIQKSQTDDYLSVARTFTVVTDHCLWSP